MARRGDQLREHILWVAKDVFLERGFERASMDEVAARAETSKRSLYAHFASKEKLFLAVIELVRGLFLARLKMPEDYSEQPVDAIALFCCRYLEILLYEASVQMCRISMAETSRFPAGAAQHFDVMFSQVESRLSAYLKKTFKLSGRGAKEAAEKLLGELLYPRLVRALFGIDHLPKRFAAEVRMPNFNTGPIRMVVRDFIKHLHN